MQNNRVVWLAVIIIIVLLSIIALAAIATYSRNAGPVTQTNGQTDGDGINETDGIDETTDGRNKDSEPFVPANAKDLNQNEI